MERSRNKNEDDFIKNLINQTMKLQQSVQIVNANLQNNIWAFTRNKRDHSG
jgi:hypothetical protein